jgi:small subunit ribosomal protein S13
MARIIGVEVPPNKRIDIALRYIYGIGPSNSRDILAKEAIDRPSAPRFERTQLSKSSTHSDGKYIEGDLRREIGMNLKRLQGIMLSGHPAPPWLTGSRPTHPDNARTRKGPRKTVGAVRNPAAKTGIH